MNEARSLVGQSAEAQTRSSHAASAHCLACGSTAGSRGLAALAALGRRLGKYRRPESGNRLKGKPPLGIPITCHSSCHKVSNIGID